MGKAEEVVDAFTKQFPDCRGYSNKPGIDDVETFMRPFAPISYEVQQRIDNLLKGKGLSFMETGLHDW